ncbi:MAG: amino acid transporter [Actinomycetota bacterium]
MSEEPRVATDEELYGPWDSYSPERVAEIMSVVTRPWWIAGGWAIEFHLGGPQRREHEDVDVLVLREDAVAVQRELVDWDLHLASREEGVRSWEPGAGLPDDVGDIWIREPDAGAWRFQLMLNPSDGQDWICKRDRVLRLPLAEIGLRTQSGVPYLRPEIQLLHKGTGSLGIREKDEEDFRAALPLLDAGALRWLRDALRRVRTDHPWLDAL